MSGFDLLFLIGVSAVGIGIIGLVGYIALVAAMWNGH